MFTDVWEYVLYLVQYLYLYCMYTELNLTIKKYLHIIINFYSSTGFLTSVKIIKPIYQI